MKESEPGAFGKQENIMKTRIKLRRVKNINVKNKPILKSGREHLEEMVYKYFKNLKKEPENFYHKAVILEETLCNVYIY